MDTEEEFDLEKLLGAYEARASTRIAIYLPNRDRDQNPIESEPYVELGMRLLSQINLGVTRLPASQGMWIDETEGTEVFEDTVVLYSFIRRPEIFKSSINQLVGFLHKFGRECRQGELLVEFCGETSDERYYAHSYTIRFDQNGNVVAKTGSGSEAQHN